VEAIANKKNSIWGGFGYATILNAPFQESFYMNWIQVKKNRNLKIGLRLKAF
jgi:hypothetical protein